MPLLLRELLEQKTELGVWQIEETSEWFSQKMTLSPEEKGYLEKKKKRTED